MSRPAFSLFFPVFRKLYGAFDARGKSEFDKGMAELYNKVVWFLKFACPCGRKEEIDLKKAFEYRASSHSPFVMLAFLCCLASFACRVWHMAGIPRPFTFAVLLVDCILPIFAVVLFGILALRKSLKSSATALPYLLFALFAAIRTAALLDGMYAAVCVALCVLLALFYDKTVRGRVSGTMPLLLSSGSAQI